MSRDVKSGTQLSMTLTRFQADKRLWIWSSLILFVVSLWIPWVPPVTEGSSLVSPVRLVRIMLDMNRSLHSERRRIDANEPDWLGIYLKSTFFLCPSVLFSVLFGWLLQCTIVMLRDAVYKRRELRP